MFVFKTNEILILRFSISSKNEIIKNKNISYFKIHWDLNIFFGLGVIFSSSSSLNGDFFSGIKVSY